MGSGQWAVVHWVFLLRWKAAKLKFAKQQMMEFARGF
jgi:hypothetical protein